MTTDPGYNEPPKKSNALWYILGGVGVVLVVICLGCGGCMGVGLYFNNDQEKKVAADPGTDVTAEELSKAYKDNAANANSTYQAKVLKVTGVVSKATAGNDIELTGTAGGEPIHCQAALSKMSLFQGITPGQTVTVHGFCGGSLLNSIMMTQCDTITKK
jgi:hypothetical protein